MEDEEPNEGDVLREFAEDETGGFNGITRAYKSDPSLENYIRLRRENPDGELEVSIHGGIDQLFYMDSVGELKKYGISAREFAYVLDADQDTISQFALFFMEKIVEAEKLRDAGETHLIRRGLAVPNKLIDWFITCALDAMSWNNEMRMNRDLIVLIRERLGGSDPEYERAAGIHEKKQNAALIAGQLKAQGVDVSFRKLGEVMGLSPTTIMRWFKPREFEKEVEIYQSWFHPDGTLRDFISESALQSKERAQRQDD